MLSRTQVTQMALNLGFDLVGFAPAGPTPGAQAFLDWLSAGFHGEMHYLAREPLGAWTRNWCCPACAR